MRRLISVLVLFLCVTSLGYGQKTRFGQAPEKPKPVNPVDPGGYTIKVHISATRFGPVCGGNYQSCTFAIYADSILDGKKIQLIDSGSKRLVEKGTSLLLVPGDYQAKLTKEVHNADSTAIYRQYDLLLPDGQIWHCSLNGISE